MSKFLKPEVKASLLKAKASKQEITKQIELLQETRARLEQVSQDIDIAMMSVENKYNSVLVGLGNLSNKIDATNKGFNLLLAVAVAIGTGLISLLLR